MTALLQLSDLAVAFGDRRRAVTVVDGVSLSIQAGEVVGLVGESGSGKSVTALSILGLLGATGRIVSGRVLFEGRDLAVLDGEALRRVRGREIAMVFQEPMTSLNPLFRSGFQIAEVLATHLGLGRAAARARAIELMTAVGVPAPEARVDDYPHQLSGGMRQRVMIAIALACSPRLLIADEPTTALDVTIQAQILDLMRDLKARHAMAILMITHDLGVIAGLADRVVVMYAGQVVEEAPVRALFWQPRHPYTRLLLRSIPRVADRRGRLDAIQGAAPSPNAPPPGCRFHPRCPAAVDQCRSAPPPLESDADGRRVRCWRADDPAVAGLIAA